MTALFERPFWDYYARSYDNLAKQFRPYQSLIVEVCDHIDRIAMGRSLRILDAGCGTGNYSWELARRGHEVVSIDRSPAMLARAKSKYPDTKQRPRFFTQDLMQPLPFLDGEFDAAISTMVLYALPQPALLVQELARVVKPEGSLVAVTMRSHVQVVGAVMEAYQRHGIREAIRTVTSQAGVGLCNLIINLRQRSGSYSLMDEEMLAAFLDQYNWTTQITSTTYTCDLASLAVAKLRT